MILLFSFSFTLNNMISILTNELHFLDNVPLGFHKKKLPFEFITDLNYQMKHKYEVFLAIQRFFRSWYLAPTPTPDYSSFIIV